MSKWVSQLHVRQNARDHDVDQESPIIIFKEPN